MYSRFLCSLIAVLLVYGAVYARVTNLTPQPQVSDEEQAVYAALFAHMFDGDKSVLDATKIKVLVIRDETAQFNMEMADDSLWIKDAFPEISPQTISDYKLKNKNRFKLADSFDLEIKHELVASERIDRIFKNGIEGWQLFNKLFPQSGGFVSLSRVGFNYDMNQALVYLEHSCGGLCGSGNYVFLSKTDNHWRVSKQAMVWIS